MPHYWFISLKDQGGLVNLTVSTRYGLSKWQIKRSRSAGSMGHSRAMLGDRAGEGE